MSFQITNENEVVLCVGDPDCQAAHVYLLNALTEMAGSSMPATIPLSTRTIGNLGEFIAFCAGREHRPGGFIPFPANAFTPLSDIAKPEVDIIWLLLTEDESQDVALVQEVKTTGDPSMAYASTLMDDYAKLFGADPRFTLQTRLQAIKNELEFKMKRRDLCRRVDRLAGVSPAGSPRIRLIPTAVHELEGSFPVRKMTAIRTALLADGWPSLAVEPWSIALSMLTDRLHRLSQGSR